jgi:beta-glucanase (GH16 family)
MNTHRHFGPALLGAMLLVGPASARQGASVRFGIVTDVHYADRDPAGGRFYRESRAKLAEFVSVMNEERPDFIVELGDFKDQDVTPDPVRTLQFARTADSILGVFRGRRYHVLGNHDEDGLSKAEFLRAVVNSGIPRDKSFYSFDARGTHFVVLDASFRSDGKDYERGNFEWEDSNIPAPELEWLRKDLAGAKTRSVVLIHQQLDSEGAYYIKNAAMVRRVLEESGRVIAVFQGHRHEGGYSRINGVHYYTLKGMIEGSGPANSAYALVEIDGAGTIHIKGFGKVGSSTLDAAGERPTYEAEGYRLVWADEFDTPGRPDSAKWTYERGFVRNEELQWYQAENARVENGMLVIEALREKKANPRYDLNGSDWRSKREFAEYTSASLTTKGMKGWLYGRFEMRGKFDTRLGMWPAWWAVGTGARWPAAGEIDMMEFYRGMLLANVAWASSTPSKPIWADTRTPLASFGDTAWSSKFHVWRMDWDADAIKLYVDGRLLNSVELSRTVNQDGTGANPFRAQQFMILNLAIGATGGDPSQAAFPARFEVDWVRVYQRMGSAGK